MGCRCFETRFNVSLPVKSFGGVGGVSGGEDEEPGLTDEGKFMIAKPAKSIQRQNTSGRGSGGSGHRPSSISSSTISNGSRSTRQLRRSRHPRRDKGGDKASVNRLRKRSDKDKDLDTNENDQTVLLPTPAFVQQASAAKCIRLVLLTYLITLDFFEIFAFC